MAKMTSFWAGVGVIVLEYGQNWHWEEFRQDFTENPNGIGKVRENQTLIHLSENFWMLRGIYKNAESSRGLVKFPIFLKKIIYF